MAYNALQKLSDDIGALEIALSLTEQDVLNKMQLERLRKFSGFGGIKAVLFGTGSYGKVPAEKLTIQAPTKVLPISRPEIIHSRRMGL